MHITEKLKKIIIIKNIEINSNSFCMLAFLLLNEGDLRFFFFFFFFFQGEGKGTKRGIIDVCGRGGGGGPSLSRRSSLFLLL